MKILEQDVTGLFRAAHYKQQDCTKLECGDTNCIHMHGIVATDRLKSCEEIVNTKKSSTY